MHMAYSNVIGVLHKLANNTLFGTGFPMEYAEIPDRDAK